MISIIITYHNEGEDFIRECLSQIWATIDLPDFEIIIVDDFSDIPLKIPGVTIIRHTENKGVGAAFDTGVAHASFENLILLACDIRFTSNGWASKLLKEIQSYPKALTCTSCIALHKDNLSLEERRQKNVTNGATILFKHFRKENFPSILNAKWLPRVKDRDIDSYEIPCILGAFYGTTKTWYQYIDGFALHRKWGTLEPYISLKSWLFGGTCRVAPRIEIGHIFKKGGTHGITQKEIYYNKLLVCHLLFDSTQAQGLINHINPKVKPLQAAKEEILKAMPSILRKQKEYKAKTQYSMEDFITRFKIS